MHEALQAAAPSHLVHKMPVAWFEHLAAARWTYVASNDGCVFWERPGYWLRLSYFFEAWSASVLPESFRVGMRGEFPESEHAPVIQGRGAKARALVAALAQWREHESYLSPLGITLDCVGVRQYRSSGGCGSSVGTVCYRRHQLPLEAPTA
jgi:hypothetical protein